MLNVSTNPNWRSYDPLVPEVAPEFMYVSKINQML